jgi:hypothetical protein
MLYEWFASVFEQPFVYPTNAFTFTTGKDYTANLVSAFIHGMKTVNQVIVPDNHGVMMAFRVTAGILSSNGELCFIRFTLGYVRSKKNYQKVS